ncbi:Pkinase-domain-containing protein [Aaosphaeria arxii CBS 175.79]|uniref:cAMP-dependent protein kinase n=1 Tax=Aaosphaeria arxii CBS 175.79 TaxID=1450172 RepID=A0A6A5XS64_9PLEO|nr:Pkinase-domain-containing protein [Aaosphaeria arxii CBS 175.79]KAF2015540.1 Pkinase-domain-containing protein [Aaosphaeria arxii CBS 175.79]
MPTLGFLKKKRTKDSTGSRDLDSPTSPIKETSSPLTPTTSKTTTGSFNHGSKSSNPDSSSVNNTVSQSPPKSAAPPKQADPMNPSYPQQAYATPQASPEPNQQQTSHNVASIQNLIHPSNSNQAYQQQAQSQQQPQQQSQPQLQNPSNSGMQATPQQPQTQVRVTKGKYTLGDFQIQRTLGTGSFGRVHLVQSKHNQRFYAVKVLKKAQVVKMKQVEHTNDERRMLQQVKHPFLITLWGTFQDSKNLYMVMDFVEGGELFSLLRKSQRFPNPVAKFYAAEVTLALDYLHAQNIIYRDLKPENLLLDRHGHLKITDFGFAKEVPDITWTLCGTPDYLAPEVVASKGYNKSVDWWSLGILIFEMLCGFTPFWDGGSPMKIYENILKGRVKYPPYIHPDAQDLLQKLITPDLTKRLGNLHAGSKDVMNHPWFAEVTWERLQKKDIDAPYVPPVRAGVGDASQFDKYPEETEAYGQTGDDPYDNYPFLALCRWC